MKVHIIIGVMLLTICNASFATAYRINLQDFKGSTPDSPLSNAFLECNGFTDFGGVSCSGGGNVWHTPVITGPNPLFNLSVQPPQAVIADFTPFALGGAFGIPNTFLPFFWDRS
jgi:hypothetical protein